jgi:leader peptidase (prepilin peptidase)/N-methyltransferase
MEFPFWLLATFSFLLGCCIGSFLNVVIWRVPQYGLPITFRNKTSRLTLNFPPSHCPHCQTPIRARHNIPIIGYCILRGRCNHCRAAISARYPLVELGTGLIFLAIYVQQHAAASHGAVLMGAPGLVLKEFFAAVMLATAAIDADTFQIPLIMPQMVMGAALLTGFFGTQPGLPHLPTSGWMARATWGGALGLIVAFVGLASGVIPRSFNESPPVNPSGGNIDQPDAKSDAPGNSSEIAPPNAAGGRMGRLVFAGIATLASGAALVFAHLTAAAIFILIGGLLVFLTGVLPQPAESIELSQEVADETREPDIRREVSKELLFFSIPSAGALAAALLPFHLPSWPFLPWLTGVMAGLLVGGGLIWLTRILGSLALGRLAMGLGDVPLMAAIGAVVGAAHAVLAFFLAPFAALVWAIFLMIRRRPNVLPYGPWLVTAGIIVLLAGRPILNAYFGFIWPSKPHATDIYHWPGAQ